MHEREREHGNVHEHEHGNVHEHANVDDLRGLQSIDFRRPSGGVAPDRLEAGRYDVSWVPASSRLAAGSERSQVSTLCPV